MLRIYGSTVSFFTDYFFQVTLADAMHSMDVPHDSSSLNSYIFLPVSHVTGLRTCTPDSHFMCFLIFLLSDLRLVCLL